MIYVLIMKQSCQGYTMTCYGHISNLSESSSELELDVSDMLVTFRAMFGIFFGHVRYRV